MSIVGATTPEEEAEKVAAREAFEAAVEARNAIPGPDKSEWTDEMSNRLTELEKQGVDWNIARLTVMGYSEEYLEAQRKVDEAMTAMSRADKSYFRLNIWGMGAYRNAMEDIGMGTFAYDMPNWPGLPDGMDQQAFWDWQEEPDNVPEDQAAAYQALADQMSAHKSAHFDAGDAIPLHKFCSNDGWLVTEEECRMALNAFCAFVSDAPLGSLVMPWPELSLYANLNRADRTALVVARAEQLHLKLAPETVDTITEDYFCEWLAYLVRGSARGGFEVY